MEVDCPRCQAPIEINDLEKVAYCQACGASLEVEMGGAGFALVSSVEDDEETTSVSPENQEPDSLNDPVLSDHTRWRVGSVFVALFGLVVLGCAVYSGIQEYTEKGMWGLTRGNEATFLWVIASVSVFLMLGAGVVYAISRSETKKYLETLENKK